MVYYESSDLTYKQVNLEESQQWQQWDESKEWDECGQYHQSKEYQEYKDLVPWYLSQEREVVLLLEKALAQQDFEQLVTLGDQIYGHGGSFGFMRISSLGKKIELAAIATNTTLLTRLIYSLKAYLEYLLFITNEQSSSKPS